MIKTILFDAGIVTQGQSGPGINLTLTGFTLRSSDLQDQSLTIRRSFLPYTAHSFLELFYDTEVDTDSLF